MYTQFFGLTEKPFSITPDPRYLYMSQRHADALAHLLYGISESGGFIQLTGEVGTGKTTLVRSLFEQLPDEADVALILNPQLTTEEFLSAITEELGIKVPGEGSVKALIDGLNAYLLDAHGRGRRTVLIVDEAQNLGTELLEQVRLLTNLETPKQKLLQIILIGQPELREVLSREDMRQVAQRVTGRYHLEPLNQADTAKYVKHRMRVAGATGSVFLPAAIREIFRRSRGVPRLINVVADRALLAAYTREVPRIDRRLVRRAAAEVFGERRTGAWRRRTAFGAAAAAVAGAVAVGTLLWLDRFVGEPEEPVPMAEARLRAAAAAPLLAEARESLAVQVREPSVTGDAQFNVDPAGDAQFNIDPAGVAQFNVDPPGDAQFNVDSAEARDILAVREPVDDMENTTPLAELLADPAVPKDTATAFTTLFDLWGRAYEPDGQPACQQAQLLDLRCWFQRGSVTYLRSMDRPAILNLIGEEGEQFQVVLQHMDADTASLAFGARTFRTSLTDLSRYWYGDSLMLWRPGALQGGDLAPGMEGEGVRWLRASLARIDGDSQSVADSSSSSAFFDSDLEARVRDYQRQRRLSVDGIAGAQTQIAINTDLDIPGTPSLSRAN